MNAKIKPQLLAPAGTPDKLRTALHFGADAVYLGLKHFSMRARAGNFDLDQLEWALAYAHERGRRVIVALNIQPFDSDFEQLEKTLRVLGKDLRPDGIIVGDAGALALAREVAPEVPLHLSTQASVTNAAAARFWFGQGIKRIVVARELSLERLERLLRRVSVKSALDLGGAGLSDASLNSKACAMRPVRNHPLPRAGGEIEAFIHGAVCIAWSGRCLLSLYWADRDPRRGACAQGCRWSYRAIEDRRRPGQANPVEEDDRGTYFFDAKDLCALPVLPRMVAAGIHAFKIEGRTRSPHYLGITVDVYRQAIDRVVAGDLDGFQELVETHTEDLSRASKRGFSTHFLGGEENLPGSYNPEGSYDGVQFEYVGQIVRATDRGLELSVRNAVEKGRGLEVRDRGLLCEAATAPGAARTGDTVLLEGQFQAGAGALVRTAPAASS